MTILEIREMLGWCSLINIVMLTGMFCVAVTTGFGHFVPYTCGYYCQDPYGVYFPTTPAGQLQR